MNIAIIIWLGLFSVAASHNEPVDYTEQNLVYGIDPANKFNESGNTGMSWYPKHNISIDSNIYK